MNGLGMRYQGETVSKIYSPGAREKSPGCSWEDGKHLCRVVIQATEGNEEEKSASERLKNTNAPHTRGKKDIKGEEETQEHMRPKRETTSRKRE